MTDGDRSLDVRVIQGLVRFVVRRRLLLGLVLLLAAVAVVLLRGLFTVPTNETGALFRFGRIVDSQVTPGIHFRWPSPVEAVVSRNTTEVRRYLMSETRSSGVDMVTGDENIIEVDVAVGYQIHDFGSYLTEAEDWKKLLSLALESALSEQVAGMGVDEVLTTGKNEIQVNLRQRVQQILDGYGDGLIVLSTRIISINPPREASSAFRRVSDSRSEHRKRVSEAQSRSNELMSKARGQAEMIVQQARSEAEEKVKRAQGYAGRYEDILREHRAAKDTTSKEIYFQRLSAAMEKAKMVLIDPKNPVDLNLTGYSEPLLPAQTPAQEVEGP